MRLTTSCCATSSSRSFLGSTYHSTPLLFLAFARLRRLMKSLLSPRILIPRNVYTQPSPTRHAFATVAATVRPPLRPVTLIHTPCDRHHNSTLASSHADVEAGIFLPPSSQGNVVLYIFLSTVTHSILVPSRGQSTPMQEYQKLVQAGALRSDDHQTRIIQKLQTLHDALAVYDPP